MTSENNPGPTHPPMASFVQRPKTRRGHQPPLRKPSGVSESLPNVLFLEVREVGKEFVNGPSSGKCLNDHANGYSRASDAGLSTHHFRVRRDPLQLLHPLRIPPNGGNSDGRPNFSHNLYSPQNQPHPATPERNRPAICYECGV